MHYLLINNYLTINTIWLIIIYYLLLTYSKKFLKVATLSLYPLIGTHKVHIVINTIMIIIIIINDDSWMHFICLKTLTPQSQSIEGSKKKTKLWQKGSAAQANKQALTLLFKAHQSLTMKYTITKIVPLWNWVRCKSLAVKENCLVLLMHDTKKFVLCEFVLIGNLNTC